MSSYVLCVCKNFVWCFPRVRSVKNGVLCDTVFVNLTNYIISPGLSPPCCDGNSHSQKNVMLAANSWLGEYPLWNLEGMRINWERQIRTGSMSIRELYFPNSKGNDYRWVLVISNSPLQVGTLDTRETTTCQGNDYGVAMISRLLKITGLFCRIWSLL